MAYQIRDRLGETQSIFLPSFGALPVGKSLLDGFDLSTLQAELARFYGDRYQLIDLTIPIPVIPEPTPASGSKRNRPKQK